MYYEKQHLLNSFERGRKGKTPEEFISDTANTLLDVWIKTDNGQGLFRYTGGFWEVLYPILKKEAPEKLKEYENIVGELDHFNPQIKEQFDYQSDLLNLLGALRYMNERADRFHSADEAHIIEIEDEDGDSIDIAYIPNQSIDQGQYFGREFDN